MFLSARNDSEGTGAITKDREVVLENYSKKIQDYKKSLINGNIIHRYRNGMGEPLPDCFIRYSFLSYPVQQYLKLKLPERFLLFCVKINDLWKRRRWGILKAGMAKMIKHLRNNQFKAAY